MLDNLRNTFSRWVHGFGTAREELGATIQSVELWPAGHKIDDVTFKTSVYFLNLKFTPPPSATRLESGNIRTAAESINAFIGTDLVDEKTAQGLVPGAPVAVKANLTADGTKWGYAFALDMGTFFYALSTLKLGQPAHPADPTELLMTHYLCGIDEMPPAPAPA